MAGCNFNGLVMIYGEVVLNKVKGCEFRFKKSINRQMSSLQDGVRFELLALNMLSASSIEAYSSSHNAMEKFIGEINRQKQLKPWLRFNIFHAFTGQGKQRSNFAEVVHASRINKGERGGGGGGGGLKESALFDVRDSLMFKAEMGLYYTTKHTSGPNAC